RRRSFLRYTVHRVLRSVPTRRSSDLYDVAANQHRVHGALNVGQHAVGRHQCGMHAQLDAFWAAARYAQQLDTVAQPLGMREVFLDRKSTRLNSSHVKISYAGFCLKKK